MCKFIQKVSYHFVEQVQLDMISYIFLFNYKKAFFFSSEHFSKKKDKTLEIPQ